MCLYPRLVENRRYTPNSKNGGMVPAVYDKRALATPAICGNCLECRKQIAREWYVRLLEDIKYHKGAQMVTLTFSTEALKHISEDKISWKDKKTKEIKNCYINELSGYKRDNAIATRAVRLFTERWRKKYKKAPRHWLISELGTQRYEHIHLHGIIYGNVHEVERIWNNGIVSYGFVYKGHTYNGQLVNYVNGRTINYMTKYVSKMDFKHKAYKPIILNSKGIGKGFIDNMNLEQKFNYENTRDFYRTETGHKIAMPSYWRRKLYTDEEREAMWMHKLDQNIRYIDKQKIDMNKTSEEQFYKTLKAAQEKSKQLGYEPATWKRKIYEEQRRNLIWEHRMKTPSAGS